MVDRRWSGAGVIAFIAVAAVVAPNVPTRVVAGIPVVGSVPGPPAVGDCLLEPWVQWGAFGPDGVPNHSPLRTAPCRGEKFGEVTDVVPDGLAQTVTSEEVLDEDGGTIRTVISDPVSTRCSQAQGRYLGLAQDRQALRGRSVEWFPPFRATPVTVGPTLVQRAAGQSWVACVVTPWSLDGESPAYTGSVRRIGDSPLPAVFGVCWPIVAGFGEGEGVECSEPHQVEVLGYFGGLVKDLAPFDLEESCRQHAAALLAMAEPTAGGALETSLLLRYYAPSSEFGLGPAPTSTPSSENNQVTATCFVSTTTDRRIVGTLVGLGTAPVPWE